MTVETAMFRRFRRRNKPRIFFRGHDRRQISGLKTGQVFDIQEMNLVLMANLVECPRWLAANINERIEFAAVEPLDGFFMVEIKRVDATPLASKTVSAVIAIPLSFGPKLTRRPVKSCRHKNCIRDKT